MNRSRANAARVPAGSERVTEPTPDLDERLARLAARRAMRGRRCPARPTAPPSGGRHAHPRRGAQHLRIPLDRRVARGDCSRIGRLDGERAPSTFRPCARLRARHRREPTRPESAPKQPPTGSKRGRRRPCRPRRSRPLRPGRCRRRRRPASDAAAGRCAARAQHRAATVPATPHARRPRRRPSRRHGHRRRRLATQSDTDDRSRRATDHDLTDDGLHHRRPRRPRRRASAATATERLPPMQQPQTRPETQADANSRRSSPRSLEPRFENVENAENAARRGADGT